jgi:hypothetical protein
MVYVALKGFWSVYRHPGMRATWRKKMKVCLKCPIYDPELRRCRPYDGSGLGCGCYVPYMALFQGECWADEEIPEEGLGWGSSLRRD